MEKLKKGKKTLSLDWIQKATFFFIGGMFVIFCIPNGTRQVNSRVAKLPQIEKKQIALTFDDGPSDYTIELSQGLYKRGVSATFFLLGENMEGRREMVEQLLKDGHTIGNHSYHHVELDRMKEEEAEKELEKTSQLILEWTGNRPLYVRPPYGSWSRELEKSVDMIPVFWSVDSLDWKLQDTERIVTYITEQVKEGDIILMHDGYRSSVDAAFALCDRLLQEDYRFVEMEEMILK